MASSKISTMKQSTLSFGNQPSRMTEVIDLVSSSDEEFQKFENSSNSISIGKQKIGLENDLLLGKVLFDHNDSIAEGSRKGSNNNGVHAGVKSNDKKNREEKELSKLCHHHKSRCKGTLLHCTVLKSNDSRCQIRYCSSSLEKVYGQSIGYILTRGFDQRFTMGKKHVSEIDYVWTCPSCEGGCQCSMCRMKENGISNRKHDRSTDDLSYKQPTQKSLSSTSNYDHGHSPNKIMQPTIWNGFSRAAQQSLNFARSLHSSYTKPSEPSSAVVIDVSAPQQKKRKILPPLVEPIPPESPELTKMDTILPVPNIMERIWIYESLVRFDAIDMPKKSILQKLECFDDWTEQQVHEILIRLACYLSEIKNIKQTPQNVHSSFRPLIRALREADKDLTQSDVWQKAKEFLEMKEVRLPTLENVDLQPHQRASTADQSFTNDNEKNRAITPVETLLDSRASRTRRAANTAARQKVKYSLEENEDNEESEDEDHNQEQSEDESNSVVELNSDDENEKKNLRKSSRRTSRQQKEEFNGTSSRAEARKAFGLRNRSENGHAIGQPSKEVRPSKEVDEELEDEDSSKEDSRESDGESVVFIETPLPPFEQRIAILSGMIELVLQRTEIRKEVEEGARLVRERIRDAKEEERDLRKEQDEELKELKKRQMDMHRVGKLQEWKEEMEKMTRDHQISVIDIHIALHNFIDANKPRSGPLGKDLDGNVYWHLSEFNETLPTDTAGHWAWTLLIFGTPETIPTRKDVEGAEDKMNKSIVYNTNQASEIEKLIGHIHFRMEMKFYEEEKELRQKEEVAFNTIDENECKRLSKACSREWRILLSLQDIQRKDMKELIDNLQIIKEYYQWHRWAN